MDPGDEGADIRLEIAARLGKNDGNLIMFYILYSFLGKEERRNTLGRKRQGFQGLQGEFQGLPWSISGYFRGISGVSVGFQGGFRYHVPCPSLLFLFSFLFFSFFFFLCFSFGWRQHGGAGEGDQRCLW